MKSMYFENKKKPRYRFSQDEYGISDAAGFWIVGGTGIVLLTIGIGGHEITAYLKRRNARKNKKEACEKIRMARGEVKTGNYKGASELYDEAAKLYEADTYPDYVKMWRSWRKRGKNRKIKEKKENFTHV